MQSTTDGSRRRGNLIFAAIFVLILFAVPAATWLSPRRDISEIENRRLASAPELTRESLLSGDYFLDWETYFKDHVVLRGAMIKGNRWLSLNLLDRVVVNDIVPVENRLLPYLTPPTEAGGAASAEAMADRLALLSEAVASYGGTFLYVGVPTQMTVFADEYPIYLYSGAELRAEAAAAFSAALAERDIAFLDMAQVFDKNGGAKTYYMSTDHHYTLKGAFLVYQTLCERLTSMGYVIPTLTENDLLFSAVEAPFLGSRSRALYYLPRLHDDFYTFALKEPIAFTRADNGQPVPASVIRLPEPLSGGVGYGAYMGGDIAETVIATNRPELPSILLFGDSFTNAVETFLYTSFDETRSLDLRHYTGMALTEYVRLYRPEIVVCLRDDANYLTETGNGDVR